MFPVIVAALSFAVVGGIVLVVSARLARSAAGFITASVFAAAAAAAVGNSHVAGAILALGAGVMGVGILGVVLLFDGGEVERASSWRLRSIFAVPAVVLLGIGLCRALLQLPATTKTAGNMGRLSESAMPTWLDGLVSSPMLFAWTLAVLACVASAIACMTLVRRTP